MAGQDTRYRHILARVEAGGDALAYRMAPAADSAPTQPTALTWSELARASATWARAMLARGLRPGERVALLAGSSPGNVVALVGHHRAGLVHVPINTRYRGREAGHIVDDSGARVLVYDDGDPALAALAAELAGARAGRLALVPLSLWHAGLDAEADGGVGGRSAGLPGAGDEDPAVIIYTSGTTGRSKGGVLSFRAIEAGIGALTGLWRWSARDRLALALPLFHVHGLCIGVHGGLLHGLETVLLPKFSPQAVVEAVAPETGAQGPGGATIFMGVPTMYARLVEHLEGHAEDGRRLGRARLYTSGSAALPASVFAAFERHTGHRILERYGMTETLLTLSNPYEPERRLPGTVGQPVPGCEARVVCDDDTVCEPGRPGELQVRGPSLFSGYWGQPEATAAAFEGPGPGAEAGETGWFHTGDVAVVEGEGDARVYRLLGRRSVDIIKTGGFKVSALEIEAALLEHPWVREVAVVGEPDDSPLQLGERIAAYAVLAPQADRARASEVLTAHAEAQLASYKKPRRWVFPDALPRNAMGKLQKHRL